MEKCKCIKSHGNFNFGHNYDYYINERSSIKYPVFISNNTLYPYFIQIEVTEFNEYFIDITIVRNKKINSILNNEVQLQPMTELN